MSVVEAVQKAVNHRRVRRASWPQGQQLVHVESSLVTSGVMEGSVIGPQMFVQEGPLLRTWQPSVDDILAIDWELVV